MRDAYTLTLKAISTDAGFTVAAQTDDDRYPEFARDRPKTE